MPILTDSSHSSDWIEPDEVPRPVVSYGIASTDIGGIELPDSLVKLGGDQTAAAEVAGNGASPNGPATKAKT